MGFDKPLSQREIPSSFFPLSDCRETRAPGIHKLDPGEGNLPLTNRGMSVRVGGDEPFSSLALVLCPLGIPLSLSRRGGGLSRLGVNWCEVVGIVLPAPPGSRV